DSPNRGKWDSLLQTNRYWLLIKQGDNALKAGQLSQAQNYYAQAQRVDSPNRGKWDSLLQTNRYWLLIKQGDNALKAGQL
ncbi:hypothetical protein CQA48_30385, partial [Klebsiella pneumoniae]